VGAYNDDVSLEEGLLKQRLLEEAGYRYSFERMSWINRKSKKIFSVQAVEDHSAEWLREKVHERTDGDWHLYFNEPPSPSVRSQVIEYVEGRHAVR
jgi:hypothetical protein